MKVLLVSAVIITLTALFMLFSPSHREDQLDDWAKQSVQLFQDTAHFFSSFKTDEILSDDTLDEQLQSLLPSETLDLKYAPDIDNNPDIVETQPKSIAPSALLPNLFDVKRTANGTSVKGQIFTDEEDKIIGAEVQLAIPTDM
ncbi:MAG: hypothetical protein JXR16_08780 [Bermanella sp.]